MAAAPITISAKRTDVVDFTDPFMNFGTTIIIKRPKEGKSVPVKVCYNYIHYSIQNYSQCILIWYGGAI